jgi:hypothetical protein
VTLLPKTALAISMLRAIPIATSKNKKIGVNSVLIFRPESRCSEECKSL